MTPSDAVLVLLDPTPGARVWAWGRVVKVNRKTAVVDLQLAGGGVDRVRVPLADVVTEIEGIEWQPIRPIRGRGR